MRGPAMRSCCPRHARASICSATTASAAIGSRLPWRRTRWRLRMPRDTGLLSTLPRFSALAALPREGRTMLNYDVTLAWASLLAVALRRQSPAVGTDEALRGAVCRELRRAQGVVSPRRAAASANLAQGLSAAAGGDDRHRCAAPARAGFRRLRGHRRDRVRDPVSRRARLASPDRARLSAASRAVADDP